MVKLLSLGPERAGQGGNALRNPFVRLGAGLLAATLIACPSDNQQNSNPAKPAPAMQSIVGDYTCTALDDKHDAHGHYTRKGSISSFSIYEKKGRFFASDEVSRMLRQFGVSADVQVTKDEKGFHFVSNSFSGTVTSVGRLENGTIKYSRTIANGKTSITFEYECTCKAKKKKEDVEYMKAVFVRPGEYVEKPQLYVKFFANRKTTVGGGTLRSVAQDLLNSGVTDVFLALKTDWAWPPGVIVDLFFITVAT